MFTVRALSHSNSFFLILFRIERLWLDLFVKVASKYHGIFNHLEKYEILSLENDVHMFALHFVYLPRLQEDLRTWQRSHNHHPVRTENNRTPLQLYHESFIQHAETHYSSIQNALYMDSASRQEQVRVFREENDFPEPSDIKIQLTRVPSPLSDPQLSELRTTINVTRQSECNGIDIYEDVLNFIKDKQMN